MPDRLEGTVILCDEIYEDRGKMSLLGAKWSLTDPGRRILNAVAVVDIAVPKQPESVTIEFVLVNAEDPETRIESATVEFQLEPPDLDAHGIVPPHDHVLVPLRWKVDLEADEVYAIQMLLDDRMISSTSFGTRKAGEDAEQSPDRR
jgi:hypothetical protein